MSEDWKLQYSVSLPPSAQYAKGDMFNIRADSSDDLENQFDEILRRHLADKAVAVSAHLNAVWQANTQLGATPVAEAAPWDTAAEQAPVPNWAQQQASQPASLGGVQIQGPDPVLPQQPAAPVSGMLCNHGKRVFKSGVTKSGPKQGQPWSAWMCAGPQGTVDKCDAVWV